jgi:hypothetical protein
MAILEETLRSVRDIFSGTSVPEPETREEADGVTVPAFDGLDDVSAYLAFDPVEDVPELASLESKIDALNAELEDNAANRDALESARNDLRAVRVLHKAGDATDAELADAEAAVENAEAAVEEDDAARAALQVLAVRKANVYEAAWRQWKDQGPALAEAIRQHAAPHVQHVLTYLDTMEELGKKQAELNRTNKKLHTKTPELQEAFPHHRGGGMTLPGFQGIAFTGYKSGDRRDLRRSLSKILPESE